MSARYLQALFRNGDLAANALVRGPGTERWQPADELQHPDLTEAPPEEEGSERIDLEARGVSRSVFDEMKASRASSADEPEGQRAADPGHTADLEEPPAPLPPPPLPEPSDLAAELGPVPPEAEVRNPYELDEPETPAELEEGLSLDDVLGEVERRKDLEMDRRRRDGIRRAAQRQRFEQLIEERFRPELRVLMQRLHTRGYPTRLRQLHPHHLRFEFTLEANRVIRCSLDIELGEEGAVDIAFLRDLQPLLEEKTHVDDLDPDEIQGLLANFVKLSLER